MEANRRADLVHVMNEYAFGVKSLELLDLDCRKSIGVDQVDKTLSQLALRVTTLESIELTIETSDSGFLISDIKANDTSWTRYKFKIYESMDALLNDLSPSYRDKFHEKLASRLQTLESNEDS